MNWEMTQLGELITVKHGYAFKSQYFADDGKYVLLSPGNFHEKGGLKLKGDKEKYYTADFPDEYLLKADDLIMVMTDLVNTAPILGGPAIIPEDDRFLHNQRLGLVQIKDKERIDKNFLYHLLNTRQYRGQIRGSATGATVKHTAPERIYRCTLRIPTELKTQRRIASTLSSYDNLIDNNLRRIKLLEDSARLLYNEWFVRLRFPGHEHTRLMRGVPEGWEKKKLGQVVELKYGKSLKEEKRIDGPYPVYGSSGIVGTHHEFLVKGPGIVVGRKGNAGTVFWSQADFFPIDTVYYTDSIQVNHFLFHNLQHQNFQSSHGAVPGLNREYAYSLPIMVPPKTLRDQFQEMVASISNQVFKLTTMNDKLRQARDILLPKLMSGEIESA